MISTPGTLAYARISKKELKIQRIFDSLKSKFQKDIIGGGIRT